jgi:hypothetical protein
VSDVLTSTDGITWNTVSVPPGGTRFAPRANHGVTIHNGRMWVVGGSSTGIYPNNTIFGDVWSSADGVNWTLDTATAGFDPRGSFGLASLNGELWVMSGLGIDRHSDVWRSADGVNWRTAYNHTIRFR